MILQGLSVETLARLVTQTRQRDDYRILSAGTAPEPEPQAEADVPAIPAEYRLAAE
jgi:hypothetical protein